MIVRSLTLDCRNPRCLTIFTQPTFISKLGRLYFLRSTPREVRFFFFFASSLLLFSPPPSFLLLTMPRVRRSRTPKAPEGFELVKPTLDEFDKKMREGLLLFCCCLLLFVVCCLLFVVCCLLCGCLWFWCW